MRWQSGTLPTDRQFTGQRAETGLGDIYDYKARFYSPYLGRFLSADTLVPGVGSQYLSRYMYTNGNPLRYVDSTGYFSEDEIHRYLENHLGIDNEQDRNAIIDEWKNDEEWWKIIGPESDLAYGDILDGTKLKSSGRPGNRNIGTFFRDEENDTFFFVSQELEFEVLSSNLEPAGTLHAFGVQVSNSLVDFHNSTVDVLWLSPGQDESWIYRGGTGYGANGAPLEWNQFAGIVGHSFEIMEGAIGTVGGLATGNPLAVGLGVGLTWWGYQQRQECIPVWQRSLDANRRLSSWTR